MRAIPADRTIQFVKSNLEYRPGMEVEPGRYDLVITRDSYQPPRRQVTISTADGPLDVVLERIK